MTKNDEERQKPTNLAADVALSWCGTLLDDTNHNEKTTTTKTQNVNLKDDDEDKREKH